MEVIVAALIGLFGTFAIAGCSLAGVIISTRRIGKPNGKGNVTQMLEKILVTVTEHTDILAKHGDRLAVLEKQDDTKHDS